MFFFSRRNGATRTHTQHRPDRYRPALEMLEDRCVPAGVFHEFPVLTSGSYPLAIARGSDGSLWFTENVAGKIGRITPAGAVTEFPLPYADCQPAWITAGPDGNIWFAEGGATPDPTRPEGVSNHIGRITPAGVITEFRVPTVYSSPWAITAGPDGNLWFTELYYGNNIGRITPAGAVTEYAIPTANSFPHAITLGPDGNLWFTEYSGNKVGRISPSGLITEFPIPSTDAQAYGITPGPDGNLWFAETATNRVGRITPTGVITEFPISSYATAAIGITSGPDGNLWLTQDFVGFDAGGPIGNNILRVSTSGELTASYSIPTANSRPYGITIGPDGNLWFTEAIGNKIGQLELNQAPTNILLSNATVAENQPSGTVVGAFSTTDPDAGDSFTYNLASGIGDADNASFAIDASGNLKTSATFDFEMTASYSIRVRSIDSGGLSTEKTFTICVGNVNEAPTNIALSNSSVAENQPTGTTIGTFSTTDPDSADSFTYALVSGAGDSDNASFTISGNTLVTAASFDFEAKSSYSMRVHSIDTAGLSVEKVFTIAVTNVNEAPSITVPAALIAFEDVDQAIGGLNVGDPESDSLTVNLAVGHGVLTLGTTTGLTVSGNGSGSVSLSGNIANLNTALASLVYRGVLNFSGADTLNITAGDGSLGTSGCVAITVRSAAEQALNLQAQVKALHDAGMLNGGQTNSLVNKLNLNDNAGDVDKVQSFLDQVRDFLTAGTLTQTQADALLGLGNILLLSVTRR